jgi:hypothetical protein
LYASGNYILLSSKPLNTKINKVVLSCNDIVKEDMWGIIPQVMMNNSSDTFNLTQEH